MAGRVVPGFLPSTSGFRFANSFPHVPVRRIGIPGVVSLPIGDASNGLCGGMTFAARDYFESGRPLPDHHPSWIAPAWDNTSFPAHSPTRSPSLTAATGPTGRGIRPS